MCFGKKKTEEKEKSAMKPAPGAPPKSGGGPGSLIKPAPGAPPPAATPPAPPPAAEPPKEKTATADDPAAGADAGDQNYENVDLKK